MLTASFAIPDSHPSLLGHFPDQPITPGVVSLDHVVRGLLDQLQRVKLDGIPQVKFLRPLPPGIEVIVTYVFKCDTLYQFTCQCEGLVALSGNIKLTTVET